MSLPSVCFVGLGYIGLPTAVVMANSGLNVIGVDINEATVDRLNQGEVPIVEPGLESALKESLVSGKFSATTKMTEADVFILAVPTPFDENHDIDMSYIYAAAESIAPVLKGNELIILESTSSPRTTERMGDRILELREDLTRATEDSNLASDLYFAHCPERILPGKALEELVTNGRIIGGETPEATKRAKEIYGSFCTGELLETDAVTAEMAKLTENSFRDVNIAFANELSLISDGLGIDVWELIRLANHHPRVNILQPGPGVGGHCIAVDPWFVVSADRKNSNLIRTAREVNDRKPHWVVEQVTTRAKSLRNPTIAALGLAFKANIDDLRESPSVQIVHSIAEQLPDANILTVEPNISTLPESLEALKNLTLSSLTDALEKADIILLLVDHKEFKEIDRSQLNRISLIDTKGVLTSPGRKD